MTSASKRKEVVSVIDEAVTNGAKQSLACAIIGVDPRTHPVGQDQSDVGNLSEMCI